MVLNNGTCNLHRTCIGAKYACNSLPLLLTHREHVAGARYITEFQRGFDAGLREVQLSFMQSDGGLTPVDAFSGHKAILSGPAGGCALSGPCVIACVLSTPLLLLPARHVSALSQLLWAERGAL